MVKNLPANARDRRDAGRCPGGGHGNPLQYSCLKNPRTEEPGGLVDRVTKSWMRLRQLSRQAGRESKCLMKH